MKYIVAFLFIVTFENTLAQGKMEVSHLTGDFYVYTTYSVYNGTPYPANGLYVITNDGVILIDSPWDTTMYQRLLDHIFAAHNKKVVMCIATHFHEDRTGGLAYYRQKGIKTYTTKQTDELSKTRGMKRAEFLLANDTTFKIGQYSFQTFYPGHGHAPDNIVVWFEKDKVLYGGCLIKSTDDTTLGNLGDANVKVYASTLKNVQKKFKKPNYIIPGHNSWGSTESLGHTLKMAEAINGK
jgi:glyoxylase-like metal-dependent hydrolase (beta-lactamase superfamily II)